MTVVMSAAAIQADAVPTLLTCIKTATDNTSMVTTSLQVLTSLLGVDASKDAFHQANGASHIQELLQTQTGVSQ